ncbi:MAG: Flp pilus assembly complex ATPase component TadA [Gemmatimonadetes bacterium]|nr:Flp pilus assembly complex ATPase component TadA [Gemmatimonadota bacterium]
MATMLGRLLVGDGAVTEAEVEAALRDQRDTRERLGDALVRRGLDPEAVARGLARQLRLAYAPPPLRADAAALELVPRALALRLRVLPLTADARCVRIAMADPLDAGAVDDLRFRTGRRVEPVVATGVAVERGLVEAYGEAAVQSVLRRLGDGGRSPEGEADLLRADPRDPEDADVLRRASEAPPIIALVDLLLDRAIAAGASDIHVEPGESRLLVRARVDGVLRPVLDLPAHAAPAVVSRLKIMAGLDIAVKRLPQDGRSAVRVGDGSLGLRVSTLPTQDGEKVVLRLLDPAAARRPLDSLGIPAGLRERLGRILGRQHGLFLVTGPTGSGKTTTLYALLESLDRAGRNILTLEDPVEYRLPGLTQVQVRPRAGLTFPVALRSVLRQDPDVIMVGEMRDRETAEVGLAAALTGHLVLSTLHTNDAPGAVARLGEMKAARYLVAGGLLGVLAQRLVRRLCPDCRTVEAMAGDELYALGLPTPPHVPRAVGCASCGGTGYRGRVGVFELLQVDSAVRQLILDGAAADVIREAATAAGMTSLPADAWARVDEGVTTLDEVRPLLTLLADEARACRSCATHVSRGLPFCPGCGGTMERRCACGAVTRPHWRFCGGCGERVEGVVSRRRRR